MFGSNEEMLAKLQAGGTGWDVFVPTNYTISTYQKLGIIEPLDLAKLPNYDARHQRSALHGQGTIDGTVYAVPKDWGTTGFVVNTEKVTRTDDHLEASSGTSATDELTAASMVHDYQLTTIGNALKYYGYSFNSIDEKELARGREADARGQAASVRRSPATTSPRCATAMPGCGVLDRRRHPAAPRHAGDAVRHRQGGRRDLDRLLCRAQGGAEPRGAAMR